MIAKKFLVVLALAAGLVGCGGGDNAATPEAVTSSLRAQANALAAPTLADAADQLMNFGEQTFPSLFTPGGITHSSGPFLFRFYPETNMYLGVVVLDGFGFNLNHVYVVGGNFGTLDAPTDVGPLTNFITPVDVNPVPITKNLVVSVNVVGFGSFGPFTIGVTPFPTSQGEFCSEIQPGTIFTQAFADSGISGNVTVNSCSFSGNTGTVGATVQVTSPPGVPTLTMTITYSFE